MKYLSKEPMVFGPPRIPTKREPVACDHLGKVHVFRDGKWRCHHCGREVPDVA